MTNKESGWVDMADNKSGLPDKVVEVMVDSIFKKNGINKDDVKKNLSDEQKQMLREMVENLKQQVEEFNHKKTTLTDKENDKK